MEQSSSHEPDDAAGGTRERRRGDRVQVMLSASIEQDGILASSRLANVSPTGALIVGPRLPKGAQVRLHRGAIDVPARVAWSTDSLCGIAFKETLEVGQLLRTISAPRPRVQERATRPGLASAPLSRGDLALLERWATAGQFVLGE